ncbi:hypothetical protein LTR56_003237 [Elasticomyces elasticus]|nr:hypothetical protein LTR56_003237 [Elasticomyces elasticus]KAK4922340.1 hypothetical protein LTR49_010371 [Elasticomyces elasticus]KAK5763794.1 hypothetical protein LTS12_006128 [Elasticomyces elasticus]
MNNRRAEDPYTEDEVREQLVRLDSLSYLGFGKTNDEKEEVTWLTKKTKTMDDDGEYVRGKKSQKGKNEIRGVGNGGGKGHEAGGDSVHDCK